jgi:hypothetical protein
MELDLSKITGKIMENNQVRGTGFLINSKCFVTAKHNVCLPLQEVIEKDVTIYFEDAGIITGKTVNLIEANKKNIDCVLIFLDEEVFDVSITKIIVPKCSIEGFEFKVYGYPKECPQGLRLIGSVISNIKEQNRNIDLILKVKKEDKLQSYKGLSGSPIIIGGFIIGVLIQQETSDNLFGISFRLISKIMENKYFEAEEKNLRNTLLVSSAVDLEKHLNYDFFYSHIQETHRIAGPRYTKELNVENKTFKDLLVFAKEESSAEQMKEILWKIEKYPKRLSDCLGQNTYANAMPFKKDSEPVIREIIRLLNEIKKNVQDVVLNGFTNEKESFFTNLNIQLENTTGNVENIFDEELKNFIQMYGEGKYDNQSWRGWMAAYQCEFPCANLDMIRDLKKVLIELKEFLQTNPIMLYFSDGLLLKGKGGVGKTHSLCDLVHYNIKKGIPSLLFLGQYFKNKSPEETILEKLSLKEVSFDDLLYSLNLIGDRLGKTVAICLDALNETTDKSYWNCNIVSFMEKIKKYKNIKLIVSCRSIYLSEILEREVADRFFELEHVGFQGFEYQAVNEFFKYYGLDIPVANKMQMEYSNPLFLKLYCETLNETREQEKVLDIEGLSDLIENFLKVKNEKISKKFSEYISPRDNIIVHCINEITKRMYENKTNYLEWSVVKNSIAAVLLRNFNSDQLAKRILDELISENIIKEDIIEENTISFSFERFFDYLTALYAIQKQREQVLIEVEELLKNVKIYGGALEVVTTLYKEKFGIEILNDLFLNVEALEKLWLSSLAWRKTESIDDETKTLVHKYLTASMLGENAIIAILELSIRKKCVLNAQYLHGLFQKICMAERDVFLGHIMLKSYEKHEIINSLIKNALYLKEANIDIEIIELWEMVLCWLTSLNDIYIRDLASKGLVNVLQLYPETIFHVIEKFENVDDDYLHERLWGAIYSSLILNRNQEKISEVVEYIYKKYANPKLFPSNILIRDFLRNIAECANYNNLLNYDIKDFRPPYRSNKINKLTTDCMEKMKKNYDRLYWNCTKSDFAIYTIPNDVEDYSFNKKEVGELIYNEILQMGYSEKLKELDGHIDYKYGSLRNRDSKVERVGKKYSKIILNRILGRIYDNYKYKPRYASSDENETIPKEQGNAFRQIDLTCIPYDKLKIDFKGNEFNYDFRKTNNLSYQEWYRREDLKYAMKAIIEVNYENEEYLLLKGSFTSSKREGVLEEYPMRKVWMNLNSYIIKRIDVEKITEWLQGKDLWTATFVNIFGNTETKFGYCEDGSKTIPVKIIPTVNKFSNESDSKFINFNVGDRFLFPCIEFFNDLKLIWNGENVYTYDSKPMFIIGDSKEGSLYVNKKLLNKYLDEKGLTLFWTTIGEKEVISQTTDFEGSVEISESYIYDNERVIENHYFNRINDPEVR